MQFAHEIKVELLGRFHGKVAETICCTNPTESRICVQRMVRIELLKSGVVDVRQLPNNTAISDSGFVLIKRESIEA